MIYEEEQMRQRIISLIHREGLMQREFANKIGRLPSNLSQILSGERHIPRTLGTEIVKAFPNVRKDWLVFGEGEMYNGDSATEYKCPTDTRPRLPKSMSAGHLEDYYMGAKRAECQEKPIITQFSDYDFSLILKNNRMSPKYERGDELFFKKSTIIEWGNDYLLDTSEGAKFKKIIPDEEGIRCVSYNKEEFPEFIVPKNMIFGYYRLVGVLRIL
jgi:hypothetical protein